jgi:hypothetical protein
MKRQFGLSSCKFNYQYSLTTLETQQLHQNPNYLSLLNEHSVFRFIGRGMTAFYEFVYVCTNIFFSLEQ